MSEQKFPSNSINKPKKEKAGAPEDRVKPVVTGPVTTRKPSVFSKMKDSFISEDAGSVSEFIIMDVIIPAIKNTIAETVSGAVEQAFWGSTNRRPVGRPGGSRMTINSGVNYTRYAERPSEPARSISDRSRRQHDFSEIVLSSRGEATTVLDSLQELMEEYEMATVWDLYKLTDYPAEYTDQKWGWTDLRGAQVRRVREGFLLDLPKPVVLG